MFLFFVSKKFFIYFSPYCDNELEKEYFKQKKSEVMNMLTGEFNLEEYKEVLLWEGKEEGVKEGIEQGEKRGLAEGKEKVQNYVLELIEQGLSAEEIKKRLEKTPKRNRK